MPDLLCCDGIKCDADLLYELFSTAIKQKGYGMNKKIKKIKWPEANTYKELCETARVTPDAAAYEYAGNKVTYGELLEQVNNLAAGFKRVNIKSGDSVIVILPDIQQAIECYYAMEKESINVFTLHPGVKAAAVAVIADETDCRAIITVDDNYEEIAKAVAGLDHPVQIILADINIKKPKSKIRKSILHKKAQKKYANDEHITPWSKLMQYDHI